MPRGPGKKENYNLNYSRFNQFDRDEEDDKRAVAPRDDAMPPMDEILRNVPPELREAYRLMAEAKESGDEKAQLRANELALAAVEKGGPEVRDRFMKEISKQMPEQGKAALREKGLLPEGDDATAGSKDVEGRLDQLRTKMEKDAEAARQQLDSLSKQQEQLERLQSPEDFLKFMNEQGMGQEDLQRMFSGDAQHMESLCETMLKKATALPEGADAANDPEATLKAADELHESICGNGAPGSVASSAPAPEPEKAAPVPKPVEKPVEEPVKIPDHRLQYQKDAEGRYSGVELKCDLPGVPDMSSIMLDVSEKYLRLTTCAPGPRYAVNAGPFPVLIEPSAARAKYSKRRAELSISVPVKLDS